MWCGVFSGLTTCDLLRPYRAVEIAEEVEEITESVSEAGSFADKYKEGIRGIRGRGLHSSTCRLIVSAFVGYAGWFHGVSVTKTAQVELNS